MNIDRPTPRDLPSLRTLWHEAFGDGDEFLKLFFSTAFSPDRCRVAKANDTVLGALYWFDCTVDDAKLAYLYAIATAKSARGQGVCSRLMADTHAHLAARGYDGALLVPSEPSLFGFYEKQGYAVCSHVGKLSCGTSAEPINVRSVSIDEYASLRRQYLPACGVLQEGENLAFLATFASFFAGDDWLLAARREKKVLHGMELLGNLSAAPALTAALGCSEGHFRVPSTTAPFAMLHPLGGKALPASVYFGLAFD